jgi:hypothetical protein
LEGFAGHRVDVQLSQRLQGSDELGQTIERM